MSTVLLSVVVPVFNEAANVEPLHAALKPVLAKVAKDRYEIIFIDDGCTDGTAEQIAKLHAANKRVKLISLSRNFGKEIAMAAGINSARGEAIMTLDGDGQHPVELIPKFITAWRAGAQVVVGIRKQNQHEGWIKKYGSKLFYLLMNKVVGVRMIPGSTDFRLIDREVRREFIKLEEPNAITRGLIDWLGFERAYIEYIANPRVAETAGYRLQKLFKLAANSFVSLSPTPLYIFGYLGLFITGVSFVLGTSILIEQVILDDLWHWKFTGTAMLSVLVLFLVGLVLVSQGVLALYISAVHAQTKRRPLYVINHRYSLGLDENE